MNHNTSSFDSGLLALPTEVLLEILKFLAHPRSIAALCRFEQVSKVCSEVASDFHLWEQVICRIAERTGQKITLVQLPKWWKQNRPLCCGCGEPASKTYKSNNFAAFVLPKEDFVCQSCIQWRNEFLNQFQRGNKKGANQLAFKPKSSPKSSPTTNRQPPLPNSYRKVNEVQEIAVKNEKRNTLLNELDKQGIKTWNARLIDAYINGTSPHSLSEMVKILSTKQTDAQKSLEKHKQTASMKREKDLLKTFTLPNL